MKSLSVILNRHVGKGALSRFTLSSNNLNFEVSCLILERSTISLNSHDSLPEHTLSPTIDIAPVVIFE